MQFHEQGTVGNTRYAVVPRTLSFILCGDALLLLRGAPGKRLWASLLNGLGGHLEPDEDPYDGALREVYEESGIRPDDLTLRALVHVGGQAGDPGVVLFVFMGHIMSREAACSHEGTLEWHALNALPWDEMVADLPHLLPRLLEAPPDALLYGLYRSDEAGQMSYHWHTR